MRYLSVQEYSNEQGVSTQSVYARIKRGTLQTITKRVDNKDTTFVVVDLEDDCNNNIVKNIGNVAEQKESLQISEGNQYIDNSKLLELMSQMYEDNKQLAEAAGQVRLLTDSEHKTKQHYFEVTAENKMLTKENIELSTKVELLQEKLKQYEQQSKNWWSKL